MDSEALRERRLLIARRILAERLARRPETPSAASPTSPDPREEEADDRAKPPLRTRELLQVLRSPLREAARFYVRAELRLAATAALEALLRRLLALQDANRLPNTRQLTRTVVQGLQSALCGCSVRVGFLHDSTRNHVDFADNAKATRPSPCFSCIDTRGLADVDIMGAPGIAVFVPVIESNECIGVLEIQGLVREGENLNVFERSPDKVKVMLQKGSYR